MNKIIVNIVCLGHSGSTLLGNILGSHKNGLHIGELVSPIKKGKPIVCRTCIEQECPIWGVVLTKGFVKRVYNDFTATRTILKLFNNYSGKIYKKLFNAFSDIHFIVDSSKNFKWYQYNAKYNKYNTKYIFLKRNPNAIIASYKRAYNSKVGQTLGSVKKSIEHLNKVYNAIPIEDKLTINYEDLVTQYNSELKRICDFLNIHFDKEMLNFNNHKHHLIGGNHGLLIQHDHERVNAIDNLIDYKTPTQTLEFYKSIEGLHLDERWKMELTQEEKEIIDTELKENFKF